MGSNSGAVGTCSCIEQAVEKNVSHHLDSSLLVDLLA